MIDTQLLLAIVVILAAAMVARRWPAAIDNPQRPVRPWLLPLAAAIVTAALVTWCWGGLRAPAVIDDEAAYLLQAQLFARGRWTLPSPAAFAAFTQPAVLLTPVLAPKMPPGHALVLAPGVLIGLPGLIPILLSAISAALLLLIVRRLASPSIAVMTVAIWLTQVGQVRWRASYYSEVTTGACCLLGWYALLRWRESRRLQWLLVLAVAFGWGAVTRPLTMLALALPVVVVVLRDVAAGDWWRQCTLAVAAGVLVLMLLPLQNAEVLGNWRRSPLQLYTRQYLPFDRMGFGYDSTPPTLPLTPAISAAMQEFVTRHRAHQVSALPAIASRRVINALKASFRGWRVVLIPGAVVALIVGGAPVWFALASWGALYLAYLVYAHQPGWTLYYLEATPVPAFLCALGLVWLLQRLARRDELPVVLAALLSVAFVALDLRELNLVRESRISDEAPVVRFERQIAEHGPGPALIFVHYAADHLSYLNLVRNVADPVHAGALTAIDAGDAVDRSVLAQYPGRAGFVWDESTGTLRALP